tara:strand:+ start:310 stop:1050 length:741 start_codon:yes stop_codon:yes gene_type:complete
LDNNQYIYESEINYIFDVDGTMTPSREGMDLDFEHYFNNWMKDKKVYFATGSDYPKTYDQLGPWICGAARKVFCCLGNSIWCMGDEIHTDDWLLDDGAKSFLSLRLDASPFHLRTGQHFEDRPGMCNFSVVGRGASKEERKEYYNYDLKTQERYHIAREFNFAYGNAGLKAQVAGETGLDIIPKGKDKSQIANMIKGPIVFFGDKMGVEGNDRPLADAIKDREGSSSITVNSWRDTYNHLRTHYGL